MGSSVSRLKGAVVTRSVQRFNAENRAQKVLDTEKLCPAPKYESDQELLKNIRKNNPELSQEIHQKNPDLLNRLKSVYVTSKDPESFDPDSLKQPENPERPLPQKHLKHLSLPFEQSIFGLDDIKPIKGRITLDQAQDILGRYQNSTSFSAETESESHNIDLQDVRDLVRFYSIFALYEPDIKKHEERLKATADPLRPGHDWEEYDPESSASKDFLKEKLKRTPIVEVEKGSTKSLPDK